ncbi:MAG TPA: alpha/beta fold hydrolase [Hyphomonadaceae bacterium]|nr:alpha/beta fold hydrolase [Hyphomonadaceae bacterium]
MKKALLAVAAAMFTAGCMEVVVDETTVFAPVAFDAALAQQTHELVSGEGGFGAADRWSAAWDNRVQRGLLAAPAPAFVVSTIEHGRLTGQAGLAWSMVSREGPNRPLVVRCGGNASTRQKTGFVYTVTAIDHGDVLLFDYPGSGETGGVVTTARFEEMRSELVSFVREKAAGRQLVLWGHSLGGFVCSSLAELLPETAGVILETTARNAAEVAKAWTPWYAGPFVHIKIKEGLKAYDNTNSLKGFKGPVLVLGAAQDKTLPVQLARSMNRALEDLGVDVQYVEFRDGGHSDLPGQPGFADAISAFFNRLAPAA